MLIGLVEDDIHTLAPNLTRERETFVRVHTIGR